MPKLRNSAQQRGFESRLSRLRFRHFTAAELLLVVLMREELLALVLGLPSGQLDG